MKSCVSDLPDDRRVAFDTVKPALLLASFNVYPYPYAPPFRVIGMSMYLIVEGRMGSRAPDGTRCVAGPNSLVTFHSGVHRYEVVGSTPLAMYQTTFMPAPPPLDTCAPSPDGIGVLPRVLPVKDHTATYVDIFERLMQSLLHLPETWPLDTSAALLELLSLSFRAAARSQPARPLHMDAWRRLLVRLEVDRSHLTEVKELASEMGMSVNHFIREFRKRTGSTPKQYLLRRHLWGAHRLLQQGASVKAAALQMGFRDPSYFGRLYRKHYGSSPTHSAKTSDSAVLPPPLLVRGNDPEIRHLVAPGVDMRDFLP